MTIKISGKSSRLESIVVSFDETDIKRVLIDAARQEIDRIFLPRRLEEGRWEFEWNEKDDGELLVTVMKVLEKPDNASSLSELDATK